MEEMSISIPGDNEGFILLKCQHCGELFKLQADDIEDDRVLDVHCPGCGLISESYVTDDVIKLATAKVENYMVDMIFDAFKDLERSTRNNLVQFKVGKRPERNHEDTITSGIQALRKVYMQCCNRKAKIKPLLIMTGCYCPFCGVKDYEIKPE